MKSHRRWLGLGVSAAVLLVVLFLFSRSAEWKRLSWAHLWSDLVHARPGWLLAALAASYSTYLVRALRWKFFLDPVKKASLWILFVAQVLGFSSIYLVGRPGEIVRPAYIASRENVAFSSQVAIWLLERIYDSVSMVVLFAMAFTFEPIHPATARGVSVLRKMHEGASLVLVLTAVMLFLLVLFRLYTDAVTDRVTRTFRFLPPKFQPYLARVLRSFSDGLEVIRNWRDFLASVVCTVVLWVLNASIFWLVFRSLGGGVGALSWWAAAMTVFFAALGLLVQLPGVGGGYQIGTILALKNMFHVRPEEATSAGILIWVIVLVPCLALGAVLLIYEGLTFRKLQTLREEGRAPALE